MPLETAVEIHGPLMVDPTVQPGEEEEWTWKCLVCQKLNPEEVKKCQICGRDAHPKWLFIERGNTPLQVGLRVCIRGKRQTKFGIVTKINVYRRLVTIHTVLKPKTGGIELVPMVVTDTDLDGIEELQPRSSYYSILGERGLCPQCQHSYSIQNSSQLTTNAVALEDQEQELERLRQQLDTTTIAKETYKKTYDCQSVLKFTTKIKDMRGKIHKLRKAMEPVQVSCPFCGWPDLPPPEDDIPSSSSKSTKRKRKSATKTPQ